MSILFVVVLALPGGMLLLGRGDSDQIAFEYRRPAPWPTLTPDPATWSAWPSGFEGWFGDRFGLRSAMLRARAHVHWYALGHSPATLLERGADGWLYTTAMRVLDGGAGRSPLSEREVDEWVDAIAMRSAALARRGIVHLVAFAPDKDAVYPERLPARYLPRGRRRVEQVAERARERGVRSILDLTDALIAAKAGDGPDDYTYFPLGDHWTLRGGYAAAQAICERLGELGARTALPPADRLRHTPSRDQGDNLATRLYLGDRLTQRFGVWGFEGPDAVTVLGVDPETRTEVEGRDVDASSAVVFHDSFGAFMRPVLGPAFRRVHWCWRRYDERDIERGPNPTVVLEVFVERSLSTNLPPRGDSHDQPVLEALFDRARAPVVRIAGHALHDRLRPLHSAPPVPPAHPDGTQVLPLGNGGYVYEIDLRGLARGRDHVVRLEGRSPSAGLLLSSYPFRNGSAAYPTEWTQRGDLMLPAGEFRVHLLVGRQRTADALTIWTNERPAGIALRAVEARALEERDASAPVPYR